MKKVFSVIIAVVLLASVFTVGASAAYTPKTVELIAYSDGTCEVPEGVTIYAGDTIIIPRQELLFTGDYENESTGEVEKDITCFPHNIMVKKNGVEIAKTWGADKDNSFTFSDGDSRQPTSTAWYANGQSLEAPGKYEFYLSNFRTTKWVKYKAPADIKNKFLIVTIDLKDPKDAPAEEPSKVVSSEEPSSEAVSEVVSETVSEMVSEVASEATSSEVTSSKEVSSNAPASTTTGSNNTWIWIVVAVAAVAVVVVIVVVASKKKK